MITFFVTSTKLFDTGHGLLLGWAAVSRWVNHLVMQPVILINSAWPSFHESWNVNRRTRQRTSFNPIHGLKV